MSHRRGAPAERHDPAIEQAQVDLAARWFSLLADPTRIRILWALRDDELDVTTLTELAGCRQSAASQHLSKLRFAGLVESRRDGRRMLYRLNGGHVRALLLEALSHAEHATTGTPTHG